MVEKGSDIKPTSDPQLSHEAPASIAAATSTVIHHSFVLVFGVFPSVLIAVTVSLFVLVSRVAAHRHVAAVTATHLLTHVLAHLLVVVVVNNDIRHSVSVFWPDCAYLAGAVKSLRMSRILSSFSSCLSARCCNSAVTRESRLFSAYCGFRFSLIFSPFASTSSK